MALTIGDDEVRLVEILMDPSWAPPVNELEHPLFRDLARPPLGRWKRLLRRLGLYRTPPPPPAEPVVIPIIRWREDSL